MLLRKIGELEEQGAEAFFGEPEMEVSDLIRCTPEGRGVVSCLELAAVQDKPKLFSTFLMWLLAELFHDLPEVGDLDKPKLVFFFDEAHLLFDDASEAFLDQVAQTVRLIRSKGVGVFFVTQLPDDVPEEVLAQLGNRVQHALRAFTPRDAKALKAAVTTYPNTADYDLEEDLTQLGTGEAMVTILSERGAPTPVVWTRMRPPTSLMAAIGEEAVDQSAKRARCGRSTPPRSTGSRPGRSWPPAWRRRRRRRRSWTCTFPSPRPSPGRSRSPSRRPRRRRRRRRRTTTTTRWSTTSSPARGAR